MGKINSLLILSVYMWGFSAASGQPASTFGVDYHIQMRLEPRGRLLHGHLVLHYEHRDSQPIQSLYFLAYPNAFSSKETPYAEELRRKGSARFHTARPDAMGFLDSLSFTADGQPLTFRKVDPFGEIWEVKLPHPLQKGESITLETPFRVRLPFAFSRFGFDARDSLFQFPYCYPRLAGRGRDGRWRLYPYSEQQEFFGTFARYDVSITVPAYYTVVSTGRLQNADEAAWLDRLDSVTRAGADSAKAFLRTAAQQRKGVKTLRFVQDSVIDFAWFASPRYLFLQKHITLAHGQPVHVTAVFPPRYYRSYQRAPDWADSALRYYSRRVGPWPFSHVTVVGGTLGTGGGMEYPLITLIGGNADKHTVVHEVGHNWFQMMLATDERQHPWLDEGLNSFYDKLADYESTLHPGSKDSGQTKKMSRFQVGMRTIYTYLAANQYLAGLTQPAAAFPSLNYGVEIYGWVPVFMEYVENAVGRTAFDRAMQAYFQQWKFQHPAPEDFYGIFTREVPATAPLWKIFQQKGHFRGRIRKVTTNQAGKVTIYTRDWPQGSPTVIQLHGKKKNGKDTLLHEEWQPMPADGVLHMTVPDTLLEAAQGIVVNDPGTTIQTTFRGAVWRLPSYRNYLPRLLISPLSPLDHRPTLWWLPLIGYNAYDGFMVGSMLANPWYSSPDWEWAATPFYGFGSSQAVGRAHLRYHRRWKSGQRWNHLMVGARIKQYHYDAARDSAHALFLRAAYQTRQLRIAYEWKAPLTNPYTYRVEGRLVQTRYDRLSFELNPADSAYWLRSREAQDRFALLRAEAHRSGAFARTARLEAIAHPAFVRLTSEYQVQFPLRVHKRTTQHLTLRLFAGKMWAFGNVPSHFYLRLPAALSASDPGRGLQDYTFDNAHFDRSAHTALGSRIITREQGYFKLTSSIGKSRRWVAALNLSSHIPVGPRLPVRLFFDAGMTGDTALRAAFSSPLLWMAGVSFTPFSGLSFHLPLAVSEHYRIPFQQGPWWQRITIEVSLHRFNLPRLPYAPYAFSTQ